MSSINVSWSDPNTYKTQPTKKQQVESSVKSSTKTTNAVSRGATDAIIKGGVHKSKPGGDQQDHVTVEYKNNGAHVTTQHVPM
ncbi:hypothetical protein HGRIS_004970 [Hohenbuehelia grisea]|uniref:Hypervirulence associated protein TUDOR domain-containing protein n=1 Tax=Hohenbuehelia grisea TaxID=104357 RepID=A0ABR3JEW3_9AGAR